MRLTLRGYSTSRYATWHHIAELRVLFDAGDGAAAGLLGEVDSLRHVFVSHASPAHLSGLLQLVQLNPLGARLQVHYPADCSTIPALADFCRRYAAGAAPPTWLPIRHGDEVALGAERYVRAVCGQDGAGTDSLSYLVIARKRTIREELRDLPQKEIVARIRKHGRDSVTVSRERRLLGYAADTSTLPASSWAGCEVLLHEARFLWRDDAARRAASDAHRHSVLSDVMPMAAEVGPRQLVLSHFSARYSPERIRDEVAEQVAAHNIDFPVHVVLPGESYRLQTQLPRA